jgi:Contractile injection system tube protein
MPDTLNLKKAELVELQSDFSDVLPGGKRVTVQFNPDSLKVSFANQIATPDGPGSQKGTAGILQVGAGTTKLTLQLWFDVTRLGDGKAPAKDVRELTKQVSFFITPKLQPGKEPKYIPPATRFLWGTFHFDGIMDSVEETLDYWSNDGKPLRANISVSMSQQKIEAFKITNRQAGPAQQIAQLVGRGGFAGGQPPGTAPLAQAAAGASLQGLADASGIGDWQSIATANGIENPRLLAPGQLLNLNPVNVSVNLSV